MNWKRYDLSVVSAFVAFLVLSTNTALAKSVTFQREYTYQASEADSKLSCRAIALEQVKRLLLEELGTYLEAKTEVKNYQLTKDQITTLTAGIVQTEIVDEKWDGKVYWLKASIVADPEEVAKIVETLSQDRQEAAKLERLREESDKLLEEIGKLKSELAIAKGNIEFDKLDKYNKTVDKLRAKDWFRTGLAMERVGEFRLALEAYSEGIKLDPHDALIYVQRSIAHVGLGKEQKKERNFNEALKHSLHAVKDCNKAIEITEDSFFLEIGILARANAYGHLGNTYGLLKKQDEAQKAYLQAISDSNVLIAPQPNKQANKQAYYNRGVAYLGLKDYHKGFRDLNKAIELDPEWEEPYKFREIAYLLYRASISDPDSQVVLESYPSVDATILYFQGKYDKAIDRINKAIEIDPQEAYAYSLRGSIHFDTKQYQQALQDSIKAIALNPKATDALFLRAQIHYHLGNYYQAMKDYKKCLDIGKSMISFYLVGQPIKTQNSFIYFHLGRCHHQLDDYNEAIRAYSTSIEFNPTYANAYQLRAFAYDDLGNKKQYLRDLKTAARLGDEYSQRTLSAAGIQW